MFTSHFLNGATALPGSPWHCHTVATLSDSNGDDIIFAVEHQEGGKIITVTRSSTGDPIELSPATALACAAALIETASLAAN
ncbi:hypothetical protein AB0L13_16790 [Saccharopolyspora shandongensis]|uniref:hypothetical protein n=1 Tax=Saccharopolyspora shandongensis TaxID=418495 RepID=UPI00343280C7